MAATQISRKELEKYKSKYERLRAKAKSASTQVDTVVTQVVRSTEVGGAAFLFGVVQGRKGSIEVVGVPVELGAAGLLHGAAFLWPSGKAAEHLHSFGDGALGSYMTTLGKKVGEGMAVKAGVATAKLKGEDGPLLPSAGTHLTDEDRHYMEQAALIP